MKIDKKAVDKLASLPDDRLWRMIQGIGASSGFDLSGLSVSPEQLNKLRAAMTTMTDEDVARATEIINSAREKGR